MGWQEATACPPKIFAKIPSASILLNWQQQCYLFPPGSLLSNSAVSTTSRLNKQAEKLKIQTMFCRQAWFYSTLNVTVILFHVWTTCKGERWTSFQNMSGRAVCDIPFPTPLTSCGP